MTDFIDNSQWKIRLAVNRLQKKYYTNPFRFLTEADIQCALYSELLNGFSKKGTAKIFGDYKRSGTKLQRF